MVPENIHTPTTEEIGNSKRVEEVGGGGGGGGGWVGQRPWKLQKGGEGGEFIKITLQGVN